MFEAETPLGKGFDILLLWLIGLSVLCVMLESVQSIKKEYGALLDGAEWSFTILFSAEYILRLWLSRAPLRYARSFFGIVDLLSCLPLYLALVFAQAQGFAVIRILRLLRMFRVLKMVSHLRGAEVILHGLSLAKAKITVFFFAVFLLSVLAGTLMYFVEGGIKGTDFTSIPISIYYAVVSITTVGYGDITPQTHIGQFITMLLILTGYAIIAVPTGIVAADMSRSQHSKDDTTAACLACGAHGHIVGSRYCFKCGYELGSDRVSEEKKKAP